MTTDFSWALIGPGRIAHRFAEAVEGLPNTRLVCVLGRDAERTQAFATRWSNPASGTVRPTAHWDDVLNDPRVDGVYIATPHAMHQAAVQRCLTAGKPVLCEKPLVPNVAQAQTLVALAQSQNIFLMEALWTRFLPAYAHMAEWLRSGAIGPVRAIQTSFCFAAVEDMNSRLYAPELAGGALLDIGIYNLSVTRWVLQTAFGICPELQNLQVHGVLASTGVDRRLAATLAFEGDVVSQFVCCFDGQADNALRIVGEHGWISAPHNFWEATEVVLQSRSEPQLRVQTPFAINGFEGEIVEAMRCIRAGLIESPQMPHAETLATLGWMDTLRARLGVRYPFEA
nr:Gfo/Idh/MocA family oxidoreductase [Rhodoferax sp.]